MKVLIPEINLKKTIDMVTFMTGTSPPDYLKAFNDGQEFKFAGLTPMYFLDEENSCFIVTSEEYYDKKFN